MTRKHYIEIARILSERHGVSPTIVEKATVRAIAYQMADMLKVDNSRFDRERFLSACGL